MTERMDMIKAAILGWAMGMNMAMDHWWVALAVAAVLIVNIALTRSLRARDGCPPPQARVRSTVP